MIGQHTPGPWRIGISAIETSGDGFSSLIVDDNTKQLGFRSIASISFSRKNLAGRWPSEMPDFHLMAAAPDLLADARANAQAWENVLELGLLPQQHRDTAQQRLEAARAVIAKATGK
jgi:hypothetical protein